MMLTDLIKCNYPLAKTNRSYMCIFSISLDLLFSNVFKIIFELNLKIYAVRYSDVHEKSLFIPYILNKMQK